MEFHSYIFGNTVTADHEAVENCFDKFTNIVNNVKLTPEQNFNTDKTSVFWYYHENIVAL